MDDDKFSNGLMGPDTTTLNDLALRLIAPRFPGGPSDEVQLLVGAIPDNFPATISLPKNSVIIGSLIEKNKVITVVLDAPLAATDVINYFSNHLMGMGWHALDYSPIGGFQVTGHPLRTHVILCPKVRGPALSIQATAITDAISDVRLFLHIDPYYSPCGVQRIDEKVAQALPTLISPQGASLMLEGSGSGNGHAYSRAALESDFNLVDVASHYTVQLERARWHRQDEGLTGPLAWSTWKYSSEEQVGSQGFLYLHVLQRPEVPNQYILDIHARWVG